MLCDYNKDVHLFYQYFSGAGLESRWDYLSYDEGTTTLHFQTTSNSDQSLDSDRGSFP